MTTFVTEDALELTTSYSSQLSHGFVFFVTGGSADVMPIIDGPTKLARLPGGARALATLPTSDARRRMQEMAERARARSAEGPDYPDSAEQVADQREVTRVLSGPQEEAIRGS